MAKPEQEFHRPARAWTAGSETVGGIWTQTLADDPAAGAYTGLLRYEAGVDTSPTGTRVHDYWEEVYLLGVISPICGWVRLSPQACTPAVRQGCRTDHGGPSMAA